MKINLKVKPYKHFNYLIEQQCTGPANTFAKAVGVSRATLFKMLEEVKGAGVDIEYNENKMSYTYTNKRRIKINQPIEVVEE